MCGALACAIHWILMMIERCSEKHCLFPS